MARTTRSSTTTIGYLWPGACAQPNSPAGTPETALDDLLSQHTPVLEPDPPAGYFLDLTATGRYAPPIATRALAVLEDALDAGYATARLGVAPTPGVARLAAHYGPENPLLLAAPNVASFLAPLPVSAIVAGEDDLARLHLVGLRTLGDLQALPRGALGDYLGPAALSLEAVARGEDARTLNATRAPVVISAARELDYTLADRDRLAHLLDHLLRAPLATLRRQGLGVTQVTLALNRLDGATTTFTASLARPTTDARTLREALQVKLALPDGLASDDEGELQPGAGVTGVRVTLAAPRPLEGRQGSLFDAPSARERLLHAGVIEARRRASARLGHLHAADRTNVLPERRYALGPAPGVTREEESP